jgi:hypothetical protein
LTKPLPQGTREQAIGVCSARNQTLLSVETVEEHLGIKSAFTNYSKNEISFHEFLKTLNSEFNLTVSILDVVDQSLGSLQVAPGRHL